MAKQTKPVEVEDVEEIEVEDEDEAVMTPKALATELDISPKSLRAFLRREFPRSSDAKNTSWRLSDEMVDKAKAHFTASEEDEDEVEVETEEDEA